MPQPPSPASDPRGSRGAPPPPPPPSADDVDPWDTTAVRDARLSPRPTLAGSYYDASAADFAVLFFTWYIRFSTGTKAGQPFALESWQAWIVRQVFGWYRPNGTRLYRRAFLWVPRGNGKTELLAGLSHLALTVLSGRGDGTEVYSIAATQDQASIVFKAAIAMVGHSADLASKYELRRRSIYCPETHAVFIPLTAKAVGKHGLKCRFMIGDEAHEWKTPDLHTYVRDSMVKWPDPLEFIISTAGKPEGYGYELWDECQKIVDGVLEDDDTLVVIYGAAEDDDISDPRVWKKANPNLGVSIAEDVFAAKIKRALKLPYVLTETRRYHFNIWTRDNAKWLPPDLVAACTTTPHDKLRWQRLEDECAGRRCFGGLDLASTRDTCSLVWVFPPDETQPRWVFLPRVWWPRDQAMLQSGAAGIATAIARWEASGALLLTEGNTADHQAIRNRVLADAARFKVEGLGADPFNAHQITLDLAADGLPLQVVPQRMMTISLPAKRFEALVLDAEMEHGNHPVFIWQADCVSVKTDDQENIMPSKKRSSGKIDVIAASVTGLALATAVPVPQGYLKTEPLLVLG